MKLVKKFKVAGSMVDSKFSNMETENVVGKKSWVRL